MPTPGKTGAGGTTSKALAGKGGWGYAESFSSQSKLRDIVEKGIL
jgi:hypothetical protein